LSFPPQKPLRETTRLNLPVPAFLWYNFINIAQARRIVPRNDAERSSPARVKQAQPEKTNEKRKERRC
jgi:hypothetical protein